MRLKSKMYLAALALPAIFASCTQDEVLSGLENQDATKGRTIVGQVTLTMDNAETRYDSENGKFEAGKDVLGMYLMDEYQSTWNGGQRKMNSALVNTMTPTPLGGDTKTIGTQCTSW